MSSQKADNRSQSRRLADKSKNVALCGILLALSAAISAMESLIPLPLGIKPGISNLPVMFAMSSIGGKYGFAVCFLKSVFVLMTRGVSAFFMSLTGGILSYIIMLFLYRKTNVSIMLMSVFGALMHNFGQLSAASIIMSSFSVFGYSPVMIISGCIAGIITGTMLKLLFNAMHRINFKQGGKK